MQYIIQAPPRTGKSLYMMYLIDQISKREPHRMIVTNMIGMSYPGVISVTSTQYKPIDWRDFPNGTVFILDEAHEHPALSADDLLKDLQIDESEYDKRIEQINRDTSTNAIEKKEKTASINRERKLALVKKKEEILDIGRSLTLHGHFGFDIYLITQDISLLNNAAKKATGRHLILRRLFGWNMILIYTYNEPQTSFTSSTRGNAISIRPWFYRPSLYKYYISSEVHNVKKTAPMGIVFALLLLVALFSVGYYKIMNAGFFTKNKEKEAAVPTKADDQGFDLTKPENKDGTIPVQGFGGLDERTQEQRQADYEKLLQQNHTQLVKYNPNNPYDFDQSQLNYTVTELPQFAGCVQYDGKYYAYTQQATRLNVSQADCKKYMSGDRPFNYFRSSNAQGSFQGGNTGNSSQTTPQTVIEQTYDRSYEKAPGELAHGFG
ncbi:zonular occludens toxin domain-containing protein [Acinetobacter puyangensis]|uniref:zonular occludens toxin domain-containing protein n=1 Tax=Acinetobacter puyangensis TaxID=1096779 RepID=UPI003A4DD2E3